MKTKQNKKTGKKNPLSKMLAAKKSTKEFAPYTGKPIIDIKVTRNLEATKRKVQAIMAFDRVCEALLQQGINIDAYLDGRGLNNIVKIRLRHVSVD